MVSELAYNDDFLLRIKSKHIYTYLANRIFLSQSLLAAFNQEKALVGAFSVITNLRMELFQALDVTRAGLGWAGDTNQIDRACWCWGWALSGPGHRRSASANCNTNH